MAEKAPSPRFTPEQCKALYAKAVEVARAEVQLTLVQPMIVRAPDRDHFIADGACGFAWVNIKPGNSTFAKWLVANGHASKDSYYGGVSIWIFDYNQSVQRKAVHARFMAETFRAAGIDATDNSRLD